MFTRFHSAKDTYDGHWSVWDGQQQSDHWWILVSGWYWSFPKGCPKLNGVNKDYLLCCTKRDFAISIRQSEKFGTLMAFGDWMHQLGSGLPAMIKKSYVYLSGATRGICVATVERTGCNSTPPSQQCDYSAMLSVPLVMIVCNKKASYKRIPRWSIDLCTTIDGRRRLPVARNWWTTTHTTGSCNQFR